MKDTGNGSTLHRLVEIFFVSLRLGLTSFGGPIAHLGYFHSEYIEKRKWMDEKGYADLVALAQFLPGPASSQVGIGIGVMRAGISGGLAAFVGFTLPSAVTLILFALLVDVYDAGGSGWLHGLKLVAVAVVAQAVLQMGRKLAPDLTRKAFVLAALSMLLIWQNAYMQIAVILVSAAAGLLVFRNREDTGPPIMKFPISRRFGAVCLFLFFGLLALLPILKEATGSAAVSMFDSFYRAGSFVFGGGHVVLPLLQQEFVPAGWIGEQSFLAGYGAAQAVPGPLFTFAAYLGAVMDGWPGGLLATVAIFLPAFLLLFGTLPFWDSLRARPGIQGAVIGVNAAVVGILLAALYHPIWTSSVEAPEDFALAAVLFSLLVFWKWPPWIVVVLGAAGGVLLA
ncbi:chromate efflux transporter [Sporosarcina trichiuri]|uniref:chromate efflux transporter n=1 Tax=Sporosarcina trichiuri TaxID=3056445 RepID=UPI0025B60C63|nr:chromate efflux transporter [Sporosarcina sp. 0.2-SM1T-5]WJY28090.1 chromate efflux transporter [Sporosarcina sp. 0.2-SM1T-5]